MTTGSVRGKCWAPQAGQARRQPASATSDGAPQLAQKRWVACQPRMPLAAAAVPASSAASSAIIARRSPKPSALGEARVAGARLSSTKGRGAVGRRGAVPVGHVAGEARRAALEPRKTGGAGRPRRPPPPSAASRAAAAAPSSSSGRPCQSGRQRARGSAASARLRRGVAAQVRRPVEPAAGEGDGLGVLHRCLRSGRDHAASIGRRQSGAGPRRHAHGTAGELR